MSELEITLEAKGSGLRVLIKAYEDIESGKFVCQSGHADTWGPSIKIADCTDSDRFPTFGYSVSSGIKGQFIETLLYGFVKASRVPQGAVFLSTNGDFTDDPSGSCECQQVGFGFEDDWLLVAPSGTCYAHEFIPV